MDWTKFTEAVKSIVGPGFAGRLNGTLALLLVVGAAMIFCLPADQRWWFALLVLALFAFLFIRLTSLIERNPHLSMVEREDVANVLKQQRASITIDVQPNQIEANTAAPVLISAAGTAEGSSTAIAYSKKTDS